MACADFFASYSDKLMEVMNCIKVGIFITDGQGNTVLLNDTSCRTGGLTREETVGKNIRELLDMGFVRESVSLKVLESGHEEEMIQDLGDGGQVFVTGTPFFKNGKIEFVVCTEHDITEATAMRALLKEKEEKAEKYETELAYLRNKNIEMTGDIITEDPHMRFLLEHVLRMAGLDTTILLTGESGTGKEGFANIIYKNSRRVGKPFIKINCAAIPENLMESEFFGYEKGAFTGADKNGKIGFFELANGGTLFLDEIGEISVHMQSKLLRALQEKEIIRLGGQTAIPLDVRIIAATNRNLKKEIERGNFREDLYYRLNIVPIEIPPLRERPADIQTLAVHFTDQFSKKYKISKQITADAITALKKYDWPGNVRELENAIERIVISFDGVEITKFQVNKLLYHGEDNGGNLHFREGLPMEVLMESYEKGVLESMMKKYKMASEVARALKINKSTLSRRLDKYGLK